MAAWHLAASGGIKQRGGNNGISSVMAAIESISAASSSPWYASAYQSGMAAAKYCDSDHVYAMR